MRLARLTCVCCCLVSATRAQAADIDEIRAVLTETMSGVDSVRIKYTLQSVIRVDSELLWTGDAMRLISDSPEVGPSWHSYDGKVGYSVIFDPEEPSRIRQIQKDPARPSHFLNSHEPLTYWGLSVPAQQRPLYELFDNAKITGESKYEDWDVIDVDLGVHATAGGREAHYTCRLARDYGYCPVTISYTLTGSRPCNLLVHEIRNVHDELLGRDVWFPWEMSCGDQIQVSVTEVEWHPQFSSEDFVPKPEPTTEIWDKTAPGGATLTVSDPAAARAERMARVAEIAPSPPAPSGDPIVARPPVGGRWLVYAAAGLGVLLLIGAWYLRR